MDLLYVALDALLKFFLPFPDVLFLLSFSINAYPCTSCSAVSSSVVNGCLQRGNCILGAFEAFCTIIKGSPLVHAFPLHGSCQLSFLDLCANKFHSNMFLCVALCILYIGISYSEDSRGLPFSAAMYNAECACMDHQTVCGDCKN